MFFRFKMASFYRLIAVVFSIVCCSTPAFAEENPTFQLGENTLVECKINTSALNDCKLLIHKSKIEEVLSKYYNSTTTNTVKIKISVVPGNNTRYSQELELPWASNIGRTIISLVRRAKGSIFTSPIFTWMLEVGTEEVDIRVMEEPDGCLPPGDKGSDLIFDCLLHQISHSEDKHVFKLCREHDDYAIQYNCCRIVGEENLAICADYSSVVVNVSVPLLIVVVLISFFMILPFVLEYIRRYPKMTFYKTSDSPMSLPFIIFKIFCEGREPAMCLFRRCVFVLLSVVVFVPNFFGHQWLLILFCCWAVVFVFFYDGDVMEEVNSEQKSEKSRLDEKIVSSLKAPFSFFFVNVLECFRQLSESECCERCRGSECICSSRFKEWLYAFGYGLGCFLISILYIVVLVSWISGALLRYTVVDFIFYFVFMREYNSGLETSSKNLVIIFLSWVLNIVVCLFLLFFCYILWFVKLWYVIRHRNVKTKEFLRNSSIFICKCPIRLLTFANIVFFTGMIPIFALSIVVGLTLNAEYFSPFVVPILTLIVYFWKNWKFSVEAKYLRLKTLINEVCKEKALVAEDRQNSGNNSTSVEAEDMPDRNYGENAVEDPEGKQVPEVNGNSNNEQPSTSSNDPYNNFSAPEYNQTSDRNSTNITEGIVEYIPMDEISCTETSSALKTSVGISIERGNEDKSNDQPSTTFEYEKGSEDESTAEKEQLIEESGSDSTESKKSTNKVGKLCNYRRS